MKLTPWFPADVLPVREGVYEVDCPADGVPWFRLFDGVDWLAGDNTARKAMRRGRRWPFPAMKSPWRGLTAEGKQ